MQSVKHAIIAAAGMGSRLGKGIPKCLVEVMGRKIIEYQLELLKEIKDIRIVVGYKDIEVIDFVKRIREDIVFVRNEKYNQTTTLQSLYYGIEGIKEATLVMDGDMIFSPESFKNFIKFCKDDIPTIGVAQDLTEDPVYVDIIEDDESLLASGFMISPASKYEWANIAVLSPDIIENRNIPVYEQLKKSLPLRAAIVERLEIDTLGDLKNAEEAMICNPAYKTIFNDNARSYKSYE